ncbi:hypothetical protein NMW45_00235 [Pasteurella multocida]|nr:hypothetical protein [Pasteurella multocida]
MLNLKIAYSPLIRPYFHTNRELVSVQETDFTDIGAIILSSEDIEDYIDSCIQPLKMRNIKRYRDFVVINGNKLFKTR